MHIFLYFHICIICCSLFAKLKNNNLNLAHYETGLLIKRHYFKSYKLITLLNSLLFVVIATSPIFHKRQVVHYYKYNCGRHTYICTRKNIQPHDCQSYHDYVQ